MMTLADKSLLLGGDNKPPMLEKHLSTSYWPSSLCWSNKLKEYIELTPAEAIQADSNGTVVKDPRQQATIYNGKVTVQPVQGRQTTYAAGTTRKYTPGASGSNTGKQRTVSVTIAKGRVILPSTKNALKANLSRNGSDALTEVHNPDNLTYDLINQSEQIMTSSEQSNDVNQTKTEITSDSNIIPYSQYLSETQQETV
ncbi:hypothetical protein Tco_0909260 [Tanacetum coccineum]|uniref:Uncharacterized protein n=1 Tax=Tanacetum coccineum TaxID=301880 RepID=A0ABQ5CPM2_9ASTR